MNKDLLNKIIQNKKKSIKIAIGILIVIAIIFGISVFRAIDRVGEYKVDKPYEDLTFTEKTAALLKGYKFDTRKELEDKGLILTPEKKEAKAIGDIYKDLLKSTKTSDSTDTDKKIKQCEDALKKLHEENSSGRVKGENLINFMDESIELISNYKTRLEALNRLDTKTYNEYIDKVNDNFKRLNNDLDRLGFK
ncbi:hypothetical protein CLOBY_26950 [Clostridium saccharobutylicum]|uniref:hypothetical protein n=1 Tax=Clostridium saccharobutylicum TaxID=169679 RepID=UPI000983D1DB|nr:hypothetical protein [Clostridium saccharobutylicum]AQS10550.1 hypothetical protein CLOBY_26950 [Clostridium saccharobutylicum]MBC2438093.1 hypothetical protein [Clostridium saccharobutylicum]NSB90449.1 hypothetical protein [Clostridium saccharobutylicum]NYC31504.1 hypothetical protein [Clostridium saccharobutylicum]OOM18823.1 hypothetical protein CLSAB_02810 [Clostridium saccharobutylicum]